MAKNFTVTVNDMQALEAAHPDAITKKVVISEDKSRLYELAVAHFNIGTPLPGCSITRISDGKVLRVEDRDAALNNLRDPNYHG